MLDSDLEISVERTMCNAPTQLRANSTFWLWNKNLKRKMGWEKAGSQLCARTSHRSKIPKCIWNSFLSSSAHDFIIIMFPCSEWASVIALFSQPDCLRRISTKKNWIEMKYICSAHNHQLLSLSAAAAVTAPAATAAREKKLKKYKPNCNYN